VEEERTASSDSVNDSYELLALFWDGWGRGLKGHSFLLLKCFRGGR